VSAHLHTFFGNKSLNSNSTPASLQANAGTTCVLPDDHAAYWIPVACSGPCNPVQGGDPSRGPFTNVVKPVKIFAYYFGVPLSQAKEAQFPIDMQVVGGNANATSEPTDKTRISFSCGNGGSHSSPVRTHPYDCTSANGVSGTDGVVAIVNFPYCLAGGVFSYAGSTGLCPAGYTTLGQVQIHTHYGLNNTGFQNGSKLAFSSGPFYTYHGDFMNGWNQSKLQRLVSGCLNVDRDCGFLNTSNPGP
jgi:hypothetical protein